MNFVNYIEIRQQTAAAAAATLSLAVIHYITRKHTKYNVIFTPEIITETD